MMASKFPGRDSDEEEYFALYCDDLKQAGVLVDYYCHNTKYNMIPGVYCVSLESKKRSTKEHRNTLAQPKTYTVDFELRWNVYNDKFRKFVKILSDYADNTFRSDYEDRNHFFWAQNRPAQYTSHIDIKPAYCKRDSDIAVFSWKRSLLLSKHKINVQAVVIEDLFAKTFTPSRYLYNDTGKNYRCKRINKKNVPIKDLESTVTLEQFLRRN